jgi:beta-xylosidase
MLTMKKGIVDRSRFEDATRIPPVQIMLLTVVGFLSLARIERVSAEAFFARIRDGWTRRLAQPFEWYASPEAVRMADNVLLYRLFGTDYEAWRKRRGVESEDRIGSIGSAPWVPDQRDGTYHNPVLFLDIPDPDAIRVDGVFYLVTSTFGNVPGLTLLHSKDLVNWAYLTNVLPRLEPAEAFARPSRGNGVWAPSIRYHDRRYRIFFPDPDHGLFVTTAARPEGPWSAPVAVKTGRGLIDPCPFWDDDGRVWMIHAWARSRAGINNILTLHELSADGAHVVDEGVTVVDGNALPGYRTLEGPKLYKRNGYYYIFAPAGGVKEGWQSVFRAKAIAGPYEDRIVLEQGSTEINGPHQGAWVETESGEGWFLHFQDRGAFGRVVHLQPLRWKDDWPVIGADEDGDGRGEPVRIHRKPDVSPNPPAAVLPMSDDFDSPSLGPQWQWEANPRDGWHALTEDGMLRLFSQRADETDRLWPMPSVLTQRLPGPAAEVTTEIRFSPRSEGERAGLLVLGMDYSWIGALRLGGDVVISRGVCRDAPQQGREEIVAFIPAPPGPIFLRVKVDERAMCRFSYSWNNRAFTTLGPDFQAVAGRWVGARLGLFAAASPGASATGHADIGWFHVAAPSPAASSPEPGTTTRQER